MKQRYGLSGYQLKMIAIVFMFLDHVYMHVLQPINAPQGFEIFDLLSRFVAPLFIFLMVEGFFYTRSRKKYLQRLLGAGVVMAGGNIITHLVVHTSIDFFTLLNPNIFLSLAGGFGIIWLLDTIVEDKKWWFTLPLLLVTGITLTMTEGSLVAALFPYIMYASKKTNKNWILYAGILLFSLWQLNVAFSAGSMGNMSLIDSLTTNSTFLVFTVLPFIYLYNGQKGGKGTPFEKNFFYGFYPIHIWILYIIGQLLIH
ncbi:TraX family protein [Lactococcus garvieae]|uniref:TraX family protein n=1 Tax=Lactococcus garvieae TaxID=1363 RepID=UPI0002F6A603|nr:TraX family protein [Lactococcus garvieae]